MNGRQGKSIDFFIVGGFGHFLSKKNTQITSRTGFNLSSTFVSMYLQDRSIVVKSRTRVAYLTTRAEESSDTHVTHTYSTCARASHILSEIALIFFPDTVLSH